MGKGGGAERGRGEPKVEALEFDIVSVKVYVVKVEASEPFKLDEVLNLKPQGVVLALMDPSKASACEAALALLYMLEDAVLGIRRIKDDNIALLAYLTRSKQARQALEAAGEPRGLVAVSLNRDALTQMVRALTGTTPPWVKGYCSGDTLSSLAEFRLTDILGK